MEIVITVTEYWRSHSIDSSNVFHYRHSVRFSEIDVISEENCTTVEEEEICRQEFGVEQITVHPDYDKDSINKQHDIAIVKLAEDVTFGKYVKPICLPFDELVAEMPIKDEEFTVTGWGQTEKGTHNFNKKFKNV